MKTVDRHPPFALVRFQRTEVDGAVLKRSARRLHARDHVDLYRGDADCIVAGHCEHMTPMLRAAGKSFRLLGFPPARLGHGAFHISLHVLEGADTFVLDMHTGADGHQTAQRALDFFLVLGKRHFKLAEARRDRHVQFQCRADFAAFGAGKGDEGELVCGVGRERVAKGGSDLNFGSYGLKAQEPERVTARQIEAARRAITRHMKRAGRVWIRIFPDVPVTSKPTEVRMGKGKGSVDYWAAKVKPGRIMFEIDGVSEELAREALRLGAAKLSVKTRFVQRIAE